MGTVATYSDRARIKVADSARTQLLDSEVVGILNGILETIYQSLVGVGSNLVYSVGEVTTVDGTPEYSPSFSFDGFLRNGSWVDGEDIYLSQVPETDKIKWDYDSTTNQPEVFYLTEDGKVGYLWVPDAAYTIHHTYWKPLTALSNYSKDDFPWGGIFNRAIERLLIVEMLEMQGKDASLHFGFAQQELDRAMEMVYTRGIKRERVSSNMFSIGGI